MAFQIGDRVTLLKDRDASFGLLPGMTGTVAENENPDCPGIDYDNWHNGHDLYGETVDSGWWTRATDLSLFIEAEEAEGDVSIDLTELL